jgi:hypothetical protein
MDERKHLIGGVIIDHLREAADRLTVHPLQRKDDTGKFNGDSAGE